MKYLLNSSGIPKNRQCFNKLVPASVDYEAFTCLAGIRESIDEFVTEGQQLYIHSKNCGNGKTTWAIKLMLQYFNEVWAGNGFEPRGLFINVPLFIMAHKNNISAKDEHLAEVIKLIPKVDLIVWDDIGIENLTQYEHDILISYIDQRVLEGLSNIYTGNIQPDDLATKLGERLASRINYSTKIELQGGDMRHGSIASSQ
jgi:DNA replication protein DnaC